MTPKGRGVPSRGIRLGNLTDVWKEWVEHGSLPRVAISGCLVPDIESSFFWITDVEVTQNNAHTIGIYRPVRVNRTPNLPRNCLKVSSGSKWTLTNNKVVPPRLNVHKVITAVTSNLLCHNSLFFRLKVPVNADSRSSRVFVIRNKSTKEPKSRSQHLNSLKVFVLSMHLLETNDVVVILEFFFFFLDI